MVLGTLSKLKIKKTSSESDSARASKESLVSPSDSSDEVDEIGTENQSILLGIISQLRPGCDLTRITLPTFILEKKSMLERITNAFFTPQIVLQANDTDDPVERFLLIVKWYLSGWHIAPKAVKKPLNPVLGEVFACRWEGLPGNCTSYYISEQTSHHPPESSYFYIIPEHKIKVDGVVIPKSKFLGNSSAAMMEGIARLTLGERGNEVYTMTQPNVYCRGILFGKLRYELGDHMLIKCPTTGLEADIEFKTKGFISGSYDSIEGVVKDGDSKQLYSITGKWNGVMEFKKISDESKDIFYDTASSKLYKPIVRPIDEQYDYESRNLWDSTIQALDKNDHEVATEEKFRVEDNQRILAKERLEQDVLFESRFFKETGKDDDLPFTLSSEIDINDDSPEVVREKLNETGLFSEK
ncbi:oxysterol-binding protein homolog 7 [[Candida] anglica]